MSHKGTDNLIPGDKRTQEEARENGRKGGKRSGEVRREKKTFKECLKIMMDETAPEKIRAAFDKNGYDVTTHREAITAAILMGAMQGNPKMVDKALELLGEDYRKAAREAEIRQKFIDDVAIQANLLTDIKDILLRLEQKENGR